MTMPNPDWPDPPGWDPTPCCGGGALHVILYPMARLWLLARAAFILAAVNGCCWMQRDHSPVWPPPE